MSAFEACIANCRTCGMPVRVEFDAAGKPVYVFAVCGHVKLPTASGGLVHDAAQEQTA